MSRTDSTAVKDLHYYMAMPYPILLHPPDDEDKRWFAEIPQLEGCMTSADTKEEALEMIEDAKRTWIEGRLELGYPIPEYVRDR